MVRRFDIRRRVSLPLLALALGLALHLSPMCHAQESLPELVQALKGADTKAQISACVLLADMARNEKPGPFLDQIRDAGTALVPLASSPHEPVRSAAVEAIGVVRPRLNLAIDWINLGGRAFASSSKDRSPAVRAATARAIGAYSQKALLETRDATTAEVRFPLISEMVSDAREFSGPLIAGINDSSPEVRRGAIRSAADVVSALASLAQFAGGRDIVRPPEAQLQSLDERLPAFARDFAPLLDAVLASLAKADVENQIAAANFVEQSAELVRKHPGRTADELGVLRSTMLESGGPEAVRIITAALQRGLPSLVSALRSEHAAVRLAVLDAFEALGPNGVAAVPGLIQATRDADRFVRWAAVRSLQKVDEGNRPNAVQALAERLGDQDFEVRVATLDALKQLGPKSAPAIPALEQVLREPDVDLQLASFKTLIAAGPAAKTVLPALIKSLKHPDARVRREVPPVLGGLGKEARAAVPALQAALQDADPEVRVAAARALLAIVGLPRPAGAVGVAAPRR